MIRNANISDRSAIKSITEAIGFDLAEVDTVLSSFDQAFNGGTASVPLWLVDDDGSVQGLAYVEPERMTDGTYNLLLLAVHPSQQKQGRGAELVKQVEHTVMERGGRILLIETMATEDFAHVRRLYERLGFEKEAQIRDFYAEGYDKLIFWKAIDKA